MDLKIDAKDMFPTRIWKRKFELHEELAPKFLEYLSRDRYSHKHNSSLLFTPPNLHKVELFKPFVDWISESVSEIMLNLGHEPEHAITGLWSTTHLSSGSHHRHSHANSFIAGVYYLKGVSGTAGTMFYNADKRYQCILPAYVKDAKKVFVPAEEIPFMEGHMIFFPAWLEHSTHPNNSGEDRQILAFNSMPVGKTNCDFFDRYNYQSLENVPLLEIGEPRYR